MYLFLEKWGGRERNIDVREKHQSVACPVLPEWGRTETQVCSPSEKQTGVL